MPLGQNVWMLVLNRTMRLRFLPLSLTLSMYDQATLDTNVQPKSKKKILQHAVEILGTKKEHVIVVFEENPSENWFLAGTRL